MIATVTIGFIVTVAIVLLNLLYDKRAKGWRCHAGFVIRRNRSMRLDEHK